MTHGEFKESIERLKSLLGSLEKPSGACSLAFSDRYSIFHAYNVSDSPFPGSWVIDSRAIGHMTNSTLKFDS